MMLSRLQYKYLVVVVFMFGLFMDLLDSTVVNVALPRLSQDFHASTAAVEWTVTGYLLSLAVFIPGAGYFADRFGNKRIFMLAMTIFVVASGLCGLAQSLPQLVAFRFLQGMGGGMMTPVSTAILSREFPGEERAKASAYISVPAVFAPVLGPVVGGYLVQYASWRWIFYINLPVGIVGLLFAARYLREHREPYAQRRFDAFGLALGSFGTVMLLYALSEAAEKPWTSRTVAGWGALGLVLLLAFTLRELSISYPVLDLRLYRRFLFALGNAMTIWAFAGFTGFSFLLALYLQELHGMSPMHAGIVQAPSALSTAISLPLASRFYRPVGPKRMTLLGFGIGALVALPFVLLDQHSSDLTIALLIVLRGLPTSFGMVASSVLVYGPLEGSKQGPASSINSTVRQVAASFGVALCGTVLVSRTNTHLTGAVARSHLAQPTQAMLVHANVMAYHDAFLVTGLLLVFSFALAFLVNDRKAHAAMRTHGMRAVSAEEALGTA